MIDPRISNMLSRKDYSGALKLAEELGDAKSVSYLEYRCAGIMGVGLTSPGDAIFHGKTRVTLEEADEIVRKWRDRGQAAKDKEARKGGLIKKVFSVIKENTETSIEDLASSFPEASLATLEAYRKSCLKKLGIAVPRKKREPSVSGTNRFGMTQGILVHNWLDDKDLISIGLPEMLVEFPNIPSTSLLSYLSQARRRKGVIVPRKKKENTLEELR